MRSKNTGARKALENVIHLIFLLCGIVAVGFVLVISVYLILSGLPAIREIGLWNFLFGKEWASTAADPKFGILPFLLTSVYGTAGAILIGVPVGFVNVVEAKEEKPFLTKSIEAVWSRFTFSVCAATDGVGSRRD